MPRGLSDTESRQYYESFEQFYESLKDQSALQHFQGFFSAIQKVEDEISRLHTRDRRFGRIPLLTAEARRNLLSLHESLGKEAESLIAGNQISAEQKAMVAKISGLASRNYRHLNAYDPAQPRRLSEILEDARTLTLDTRGLKLNETVGSNQNRRQPLTFLDDSGRKVTGVFTPKNELRVWENWEQSIQKLADETSGLTPAAKKLLKGFMAGLDSDYAADYLKLPKNADHGARLAALYTKVFLNYHPSKPEDVLCDCISEFGSSDLDYLPGQEIKKMLGKQALEGLKSIMFRDNPKIINNFMIAKIHDGARSDNRNAAMSAVAELLNVPNLLAKSVPMKVITGTDKSGNPIVADGTFMLKGKGVDSLNLKEAESKYGLASLKNLDGKAMKSIADLQILDFICGNTDRHGGNILYQFDEKTKKLIGIQGIDNDNAFGTLVPEKESDFTGHFVSQQHLRLISSSMYERLKTLTPDTLKFSLRGYGLTEEELNAAVERLNIVKDAVKKDLSFFEERDKEQAKTGVEQGYAVENRIRVVPDEKWKTLKWSQLEGMHQEKWYHNGKSVKRDKYNTLFNRVQDRIMAFGKLYKNQVETKKDYRSLESEFAIGAGNRTYPETIAKELQRAKDLEALLESRTEKDRTSPNYTNLQEAVKNYRVNLETLDERLRNANSGQEKKSEDPIKEMDGIVTVGDLAEMSRLGREVQETAQSYLDGKGSSILHSRYTRNRINAAKAALDLGKQNPIKDEEFQIAARNERRAVERVQDRIGDHLEKESKGPEAGKAM